VNEFQINAAQADALIDALLDHRDGEPVLFTMQGNGDLVVAFNLSTVTIATSGEMDTN
jgi:hypothetical protein